MTITSQEFEDLAVTANIYRAATRHHDHGALIESMMDRALHDAQAVLNRERNGTMNTPATTGSIGSALGNTLFLGNVDTTPIADMVRAVLSEATRRGLSFTAYDVTLLLRRYVGPRRAIAHYNLGNLDLEGVRDLVHDQMTVYTLNGTYRTTHASPNGKDQATLFVPCRTAPPPVTQAQNAAANAGSPAGAGSPGSPRKSNDQAAPPTAPQQQLLPPGAWVVNSQNPQGTTGSSAPAAQAAAPAAVSPQPKHWKKFNGIASGPDWEQVVRVGERGRTFVRVRHLACGSEQAVYVWSWAGHGFYLCDCGARVHYR